MFGGTAEYVALWFKQAGVESGFYWYLTAILGMATVGFLLLPETKTNEPDHRRLESALPRSPRAPA